jgi:hypothetical protein
MQAIAEQKRSKKHMRVHFTDLAIARLKEPGEYHDDSTLGFALRVCVVCKTIEKVLWEIEEFTLPR